jgi:hypothetical protein
MRHEHRWLAAALIVVTLSVSGMASLCSAGSAETQDKPARLEKLPGSNLSRVILTAKAAGRLALATTKIREESVKRWLVVRGEVEAMPEQPVVATAPHAIRVRVPRLDDPDVIARQTVVVLSLGEQDDDDDDEDKLEKDDENDDDADDSKRVVVLTIGGNGNAARFRATPLDEAMAGTAQYFQVSSADHRFTPGQRVQVRLAQPGNGKPQKVVPYSAVMYDAQGDTWVFTNPEPLVFVRQAIAIEYIHKDLAVLKEGPPTGTVIVSVGAAELMGVEQKIGN